MQTILKNSLVIIFLSLVTSCSKDFLNENTTQVNTPVGLSNIYISPDWPSSGYLFNLPSVKEADYEIVSKPSWLTLGSLSGHLSDNKAIVECSATKNSAFSPVGIYMDFMTVKANGKNYKVPVAYITEGNPIAEVQSNLIITYSYGEPNLSIGNTGQGILLWNISSMPDWLVLDTARLGSIYITPYALYTIPFLFKPDNISSEILTGTIVLLTNDKAHPSISVNVTVDMGTPQLSIYTNAINFSSMETSKTLSFSNYGNGRLVWEFQDIPEWLTITPAKGMYNPYTSYGDIIFTCDRTKLAPGPNTAVVNLKTNDNAHPSYSITVSAITPGNPENMLAVDGNITDAVFNKNTNTLYYVTSAPNKFIAYDVTARTVLHEIPLGKAPTCFAISEDWTKAAVGHNGFMSTLYLSSNTVTKIYPLDYSVYDVAWAEKDWFCCTQNGEGYFRLHWINTANGTLYDDPDQYSLEGASTIKKVPDHPFIIASRGGNWSSGFYAYDIVSKSKKSYSQIELTNFWFSENGDYIFDRHLNVYRTTSSTGSTDPYNANINAIAKINTGSESYNGLQYVYNSNNYLWILQNDTYSTDASTTLYQVEDNDYTLVKKIVYDWLYLPEGKTTPVTLSAKYVFANNEGTEISTLCKDVSSDTWVMQFIPVN
jgi:hypothetical protein